MLAYMLFAVLLVLFIYLLFVPIVLFIDTETNQYYFQIKRLLKASVTSHEKELLQIHLKLAFFQFNFYPFRKRAISTKRNKKKATRWHRMRKINWTRWRLLHSFRVKRFYINVDTGDCLLNAKLYHLFLWLNYQIGGFHINFVGKNKLTLELQNRPIYMIRSIINS